MDPREVRSARLLREKLFELASTRDISMITTTELSRVTGLARRTIYNHGEGPQDLLFGYLAEGLTVVREDAMRSSRDRTATESFTAGLCGVLEHVQQHRAIYTHAVSAASSPAWHYLLTQHFTESLLLFIQTYPPRALAAEGLAGLEIGGELDRVIASSIAHAMVGAIEAWLLLPNEPPSDMCYGLMLALTPTWFLETGPL